jgi:hypothetical protein
VREGSIGLAEIEGVADLPTGRARPAGPGELPLASDNRRSNFAW